MLSAELAASDSTLFIRHAKPDVAYRAHLEGIVTALTRPQFKVDSNREVIRMAPGTSPHLMHAATLAQGIVEGRRQGIRSESKSIEEVALAGAIGPDEDREWSQLDIAGTNALVVLNLDSSDERVERTHDANPRTRIRARPETDPLHGRPRPTNPVRFV